MIRVVPLSSRAVELIVDGEVAPADVAQAFRELDAFLDQCDRIDIYTEVRSAVDIGLCAIYEEFKHFSTMMRLIRRLARVAIVADQAWVRHFALAEGMFIPGAHYEVYPLAEAGRAREWVLRHTDMAHAA